MPSDRATSWNCVIRAHLLCHFGSISGRRKVFGRARATGSGRWQAGATRFRDVGPGWRRDPATAPATSWEMCAFLAGMLAWQHGQRNTTTLSTSVLRQLRGWGACG